MINGNGKSPGELLVIMEHFWNTVGMSEFHDQIDLGKPQVIPEGAGLVKGCLGLVLGLLRLFVGAPG